MAEMDLDTRCQNTKAFIDSVKDLTEDVREKRKEYGVIDYAHRKFGISVEIRLREAGYKTGVQEFFQFSVLVNRYSWCLQALYSVDVTEYTPGFDIMRIAEEDAALISSLRKDSKAQEDSCLCEKYSKKLTEAIDKYTALFLKKVGNVTELYNDIKEDAFLREVAVFWQRMVLSEQEQRIYDEIGKKFCGFDITCDGTEDLINNLSHETVYGLTKRLLLYLDEVYGCTMRVKHMVPMVEALLCTRLDIAGGYDVDAALAMTANAELISVEDLKQNMQQEDDDHIYEDVDEMVEEELQINVETFNLVSFGQFVQFYKLFGPFQNICEKAFVLLDKDLFIQPWFMRTKEHKIGFDHLKKNPTQPFVLRYSEDQDDFTAQIRTHKTRVANSNDGYFFLLEPEEKYPTILEALQTKWKIDSEDLDHWKTYFEDELPKQHQNLLFAEINRFNKREPNITRALEAAIPHMINLDTFLPRLVLVLPLAERVTQSEASSEQQDGADARDLDDKNVLQVWDLLKTDAPVHPDTKFSWRIFFHCESNEQLNYPYDEFYFPFHMSAYDGYEETLSVEQMRENLHSIRFTLALMSFYWTISPDGFVNIPSLPTLDIKIWDASLRPNVAAERLNVMELQLRQIEEILTGQPYQKLPKEPSELLKHYETLRRNIKLWLSDENFSDNQMDELCLMHKPSNENVWVCPDHRNGLTRTKTKTRTRPTPKVSVSGSEVKSQQEPAESKAQSSVESDGDIPEDKSIPMLEKSVSKRDVLKSVVLRVVVKDADDLKKMDFLGKTDAYVVITPQSDLGETLPTKQTRVVMKNLDPSWNEFFEWTLLPDWHTRKIKFDVIDWSRVIKHRLVGSITYEFPEKHPRIFRTSEDLDLESEVGEEEFVGSLCVDIALTDS